MSPVYTPWLNARPRLLDLFAGAQGTGVGFARAGFQVHSVDLEPHPKHDEIASFTTASAIERDSGGRIVGGVLADIDFCRTFDAIVAGPPCHDWSDLASRTGKDHGTAWMLPATIAQLQVIGVPWVVENVDSAAGMAGALRLCGSMFGLGTVCRDGVYRYLQRHRRFASSEFLVPPGPCRHKGPVIGVYGTGGGGQMTRGYKGHPEESRAAMDIDWMSRSDIAQAIPPAYTEWIGRQLIDAMPLSPANLAGAHL